MAAEADRRTGIRVVLPVLRPAGSVRSLVAPRHRQGRPLVVAGARCVYLVLSLPFIANLIAGWLPAVPTVTRPASPGPVDLLVVMDGDNRRGRARAGIEVNAAATPREVWVIGDGWLIEELSAGGVPRNRIFHDAFLPTTRDQLASLAATGGPSARLDGRGDRVATAGPANGPPARAVASVRPADSITGGRRARDDRRPRVRADVLRPAREPRRDL